MRNSAARNELNTPIQRGRSFEQDGRGNLPRLFALDSFQGGKNYF
jgi:hypothetical protein